MTIGERIKARREELNLSQEELARKMGFKTKNSIYKYEQQENMKAGMIQNFADALSVSPSYLMGWDDYNLPGQLSLMDAKINKEITIEQSMLLEAFRKLSKKDREKVLDFIKLFHELSHSQKETIFNLVDSYKESIKFSQENAELKKEKEELYNTLIEHYPEYETDNLIEMFNEFGFSNPFDDYSDKNNTDIDKD